MYEFSESSDVSLYYAEDPSFMNDLPTSMSWKRVDFTSENFSMEFSHRRVPLLSNSPSPDKAIAFDELTSTASISFESSLSQQLYNFLVAGLFSTASLSSAANPFSSLTTIQNGNTKTHLAFLKLIKTDDGLYDIYIYRGGLIQSLSVSVSVGALVQTECSIELQDVGSKGNFVYSGVNLASKPSDMASWTFGNLETKRLMNMADLSGFSFVGNSTVSPVLQDLSFTVTNDFQENRILSNRSPFFRVLDKLNTSVELSTNAYYQSSGLFQKIADNENGSLSFTLSDTASSLNINVFEVCMSGSPVPVVSSDDDLVANINFEAIGGGSHTFAVVGSPPLAV